MAKQGNIGVTSENIFPIIKKFLYSDHEIFLRELVSNAVDATQKLNTLASIGEFKGELGDLTIHVELGKDTITISDRGIGLTAEEIEKYINQIAFSGANDFLEKYKDDANAIIGHFGLGFYSAFMVADEVTVNTKKYGSDKAYQWKSSGADGYTIEETAKENCGTEIIMRIREDAEGEDYSQYLESYKIQSLVKKYSDYIRFPIKMDVETSVNTAKEGEEPKYEQVTEEKVLNSMVPIWRKNKNEVTQEEYNNYYKEKFMDMTDPLVTINVSAEGTVSYKALMFIPAVAPYG
mgnify:CR=1 FL=1